MVKPFLFGSILSGLSACLSFAQTPPKGMASKAEAILEMRGNLWFYNGKTLRFLDRSETWLQILGRPSRSDTSRMKVTYIWDSLGIAASGWHTPLGLSYINQMRLKLTAKEYRSLEGLPRLGFPGKVILQGVNLETRPPLFREVQAKMAPKIAFQERGWPQRHSASFSVQQPDGFEVGVNAVFYCATDSSIVPVSRRIPTFNPDSTVKDECPYFFNELEIGVGEN